MKKLMILASLCTILYISKADAQQPGGGDPAAMMQRYKDHIKPELIEKSKITDVEADKVIDITFGYRSKMRGFRDLSEEERKKLTDALILAQTKDYKAIPLTDEQVKAVNEFFDEQRKKMQEQRKQNGGGNN